MIKYVIISTTPNKEIGIMGNNSKQSTTRGEIIFKFVLAGVLLAIIILFVKCNGGSESKNSK